MDKTKIQCGVKGRGGREGGRGGGEEKEEGEGVLWKLRPSLVELQASRSGSRELNENIFFLK